MNEEPHYVTESYWKALQTGRLYQLLDFGWESADALKFAEWEILARKKIDEEYGPQAAMFAVLKSQNFHWVMAVIIISKYLPKGLLSSPSKKISETP